MHTLHIQCTLCYRCDAEACRGRGKGLRWPLVNSIHILSYALVVIAAAATVVIPLLLLLSAYSWNTCNIHTLANAFVALPLPPTSPRDKL